jgi:hypothetical protein
MAIDSLQLNRSDYSTYLLSLYLFEVHLSMSISQYSNSSSNIEELHHMESFKAHSNSRLNALICAPVPGQDHLSRTKMHLGFLVPYRTVPYRMDGLLTDPIKAINEVCLAGC